MRYWISTFSEETWTDFEAAGSRLSRFSEKRWRTVQLLEIGDVFICYILGKKVFVATLIVAGAPRKDSIGSWKSESYPIQIPVKVDLFLPLAHGVPVQSLKQELSWFRDLKTPSSWTYRLRNDPYEISREDAISITTAIRNAEDQPKKGIAPVGDEPTSADEPTHEQIQWLLLSLGSSMGLNVRPANNDLNKSFKENIFAEVNGLKQTLPVQFDQRTQRIIEHIDVLWLQRNSIVAAFEIEHTTSIYSGLLRMSDLIALQPNLNIDLYIVAPDDRRDKVKSEINRPTFARLKLPQRCCYIAYSRLTQKFEQATRGGFLRHLSPSILDELADDMSK